MKEPPTIGAPLLSFVAGYVDTVGFVALFGLFTAHVTGNFVLIGATLVHSREGLLTKLLALPVFIIVVALTTAFVRRGEHHQRPPRLVVLLLQIALLGGFTVAGLIATPVTDADAPIAVIAGLAGVAAMAIQNAAARLLFTTMAPTTVMTGNVTQVVIDAVDLRRGADPAGAAAARARLHKMWPPVVAFAIGALAGAALFVHVGFSCLVIPMLALAVVIHLTRDPAAGSNTRG